MSKRAKSKVQGGENKPLMHAFQGLRSSSAAGKHADKRTKRARTRGASKARAMKEWS